MLWGYTVQRVSLTHHDGHAVVHEDHLIRADVSLHYLDRLRPISRFTPSDTFLLKQTAQELTASEHV